MMQTGLSLEYLEFPKPPSFAGHVWSGHVEPGAGSDVPRKDYLLQAEPALLIDPPPSREGGCTSAQDIDSLKNEVEHVLQKVSEILRDVSVTYPKEPVQRANQRRATVTQGSHSRDALPSSDVERRAASLNLERPVTTVCKQLQRKPVPSRKEQKMPDKPDKPDKPFRPRGLRPSLKTSMLEQAKATDQGTFFQQHTPLGSGKFVFAGRQYQRRPPLPLSPPVSPTARAFNSSQVSPQAAEGTSNLVNTSPAPPEATNGQSNAVCGDVVLETGWKWDEPKWHSSSPGSSSGTTTIPVARPRKSSLRGILNRSPTSPRPPLLGLGPIENPFPPSQNSPAASEPRSRMEWDSSDDEDSLADKFRRSFGKNSFKKSKFSSFLRRNSAE